jgi:hypothetical protein
MLPDLIIKVIKKSNSKILVLLLNKRYHIAYAIKIISGPGEWGGYAGLLSFKLIFLVWFGVK